MLDRVEHEKNVITSRSAGMFDWFEHRGGGGGGYSDIFMHT